MIVGPQWVGLKLKGSAETTRAGSPFTEQEKAMSFRASSVSLMSVLAMLAALAGCGSSSGGDEGQPGGGGAAGSAASGGAAGAAGTGGGAGAAGSGGTAGAAGTDGGAAGAAGTDGGAGAAGNGGTAGSAGSASDAGPDSGPPQLEIVSVSKLLPAASTNVNLWSEVNGLGALQLDTTGGDYVFMLNVPGAWTTGGGGAGFRIMVDGQTLATTYFQSIYEQHVPLSVVGVKNLPAGSHTATVQWYSDAEGHTLNMGQDGEVTLLAMRADGAISAATPSSGDTRVYSGPLGNLIEFDGWTGIAGFVPGQYLVVLNVGEVWTDMTNRPEFNVRIGAMPVAGGIATPAVNGQRLPITMFGGAVVTTTGSLPFEATVRSSAAGESVSIGTSGPSWLIAIPMPQGFTHHVRAVTNPLVLQDNTGAIDVDPITVNSTGGKHLFILNATESYASDWSKATFKIFQDGTVGAAASYSTASPDQYMPATVVQVADFGPGSHTMEARWTANGSAVQGTAFPTQFFGM
jgi:hypothetical protein